MKCGRSCCVGGREKKKQEHKAQCLPISFAYFIVFIVSFLFSIYGKFVKFHNTFKMTSYNSCGGGSSCKLFVAANQQQNTKRKQKKNRSKWQSQLLANIKKA